MDGLTGFQRDMLYGILGLDSPHGLELKTELERYYSGRVTRARVYSNLDELAEQGFVEKSSKTERSNQYTLTDEAIRTMLAHRQWEDRQLALQLTDDADIDRSRLTRCSIR